MSSVRGQAATLLAATLVVAAGLAGSAAAASAGSVERVSIGPGGQLSADSWAPSVSADGRWTAFVSDADDLVPDDTNQRSDVFLRDRTTGVTRRISVRADGTQGDDDSDSVRFGAVDFGPVFAETSISADGRFVAFTSFATTLAGGAANGWSDVFVYDRVEDRLRRISTDSLGGDGDGDSTDARLSADGSHLVFTTVAADLVPLHSIRDVVIADLDTGLLRQVCETPTGKACANGARTGEASADGRWVAFSSATPNLVPGDTNGREDVFVRNMASGEITRVSVAADGSQALLGSSSRPTISGDGCRVAFVSDATDLAPAAPAGEKVFVRDRCAGTTELASRSNAGTPGRTVGYLAPEISDDGCRVAFRSGELTAASPPVDGLLLRDLCAGTTVRLDVSDAGVGGNAAPGRYALSAGDGRFAGFDSQASTLVLGDSNGRRDAFLLDRAALAPAVPGNEGGSPPPGSGAPGSAPGSTAHQTHQAHQALPALLLTEVRLSSHRFRPVRPGKPVSRGRGARLTLRLSRAATLSLRYLRPTRGVKVNGRCVLPRRRAPQSGPRCLRPVQVGAVEVPLPGGESGLEISGILDGKTLPRARYRLVVSARAADGAVAPAVSLPFAITGP